MKRFLMLGALFLLSAQGPARAQDAPVDIGVEVTSSGPFIPIITPALRDLPEVKADPNLFGMEAKRRDDHGRIVPSVNVPPHGNVLADIQEGAVSSDPAAVYAFDTPLVNVEGLDYNVAPPDPAGDVGLNHVVQGVNGSSGSVIRVLDKSGATVLASRSLESLWTTAPCNSGYCDPIIQYDEAADRWLLTEFATSGNNLCVYVSTTADPTGSYYGYTFGLSSFPDYPKYGVWPAANNNAYFVGANNGGTVIALQRSAMLAGTPASIQTFSIGELSGWGFQLTVPATHEGDNLPPSAEGCIFMRPRDTEIHGGTCSGCDLMEMWELKIDWATPANSALTQLASIQMTDWDQTLCGTSQFGCMPQLGTTRLLDPIREPLHYPLQYRNFGTHETLVGAFVEDVDGTDHAAVHWFEIRRTPPGSGSWVKWQEGVLRNDTYHRGVASASMDGSGNIAVGYTRTSGSSYAGAYYAGRLSTDTLGTLPFYDMTLQAGSSYQSSNDRWGDYSGMGIDPADDCTFWFFGMYEEARGDSATRIASFKFDECGSTCTPPGMPTITGITDESACAQTGIRVNYTGGAGATSHNLLRDSSVVVTGYASGALYTPGNTTAHSYVVQAVVETCTTDSDAESFADGNDTPGAPSAPTVVDVSACAQSGVSVSWGLVSGATGYDLLVDGATLLTNVTSPYTYDPGNTASHTYMIRATTATCTGPYSGATSLSDANNTPGIPLILEITDNNACAQDGIRVAYTAGSGSTSHNLLRDGSVVVTGYSSGTLYNPGDGTSHTYVVRAVNGTCSTDSTGQAFSDAGSIGTPLITGVTDEDACAQTGILVAYTGGTGAASHDLVRDGSVVVTGYASGALYNPGDSSSHSYVVRAVQGSCTADSAGQGYTDPAALLAPAAPLVGDLNPCALSGVQVTWQSVADATTYDVLVDGSTTVANVTSPYTYLPGDSGVHTYAARGRNGSCTGPWSTATSGTDANGTPAAPAGISATATDYNNVDLSWDAASGASGYHVYRATGTCPQGVYTKLTTSGPISTTTYSDGTATGGTTYAYVVTTVSGVCESTNSACAEATTPIPPCINPPTFAGLSSVTAISGATCSLNLVWNAATSSCGGTVTYNVYRDTAGGFTPGTGNQMATGLTGTTWTDASVQTGTTYYFVVRAVETLNGMEDTNTTERSGAPGTPATVTLFSDTFESGTGLNGWTTGYFSPDTNAADWQGIMACTAHGGTNIFRYGGDSCTNNYTNNSNCQAVPGGTAGLSVPAGATTVRLSFWHRWQFEDNYDGAMIRISFDNATYYYLPASAAGVWLSGGYNGTVYYPAGGTATRDAWTGSQASFSNVVIDLDSAVNFALGVTTGAAGRTLWIGFGGFTDGSLKDDGWFLDDVTVTYDVPGSCTSCAAPSSVGSVTAADASACATDGISVSWPADPGAWGDASGTRTYEVLRDGSVLQPDVAYGTTSLTDTTASPGVIYTYSVNYKNACGLEAETAGAQASDQNATPVPLIGGGSTNPCPSSTVTLTTESGMTGYQWYLDGSPVGTDSDTYVAVATGTYTVRYTNGPGCTGTSAGHPVTISGCQASEVSGTVDHPLKAYKNGGAVDIVFENISATHYQVYISNSSNTAAFQVADPDFGKRDCSWTGWTTEPDTMLKMTGVDLESGLTGSTQVLYFLVTGDNGFGTEGSLGKNSNLVERTADAYCDR